MDEGKWMVESEKKLEIVNEWWNDGSEVVGVEKLC